MIAWYIASRAARPSASAVSPRVAQTTLRQHLVADEIGTPDPNQSPR